jgi:hypothetical protein
MCEGGLYWIQREVINSKRFVGFRELHSGVRCQGFYQQAMTRAIDNIYQTLCGMSKMFSDGANAYQTQQLCEQIIQLNKTACCLN